MTQNDYEYRYPINDLLHMANIPLSCLMDTKKLRKSSNRQPVIHNETFIDNASNNPTKYTPYIPLPAALAGIATGKYKSGVLRVSKQRLEDAFISHEDRNEPDYFVRGRIYRNRAVHRDTVVFEILPESQWVPLTDSYTPIYESSCEENQCTGDTVVKNGKMRQTVQVVHILEFDGKDRYYTAMLQENRVLETSSANKITDTAENKSNTKFFVSQSHKFVKAVPFDNRIPWILIPVTQLAEWVTIPGHVDTLSLYKVQMTSWDVNSSLPLGVIKSYMGRLSDLNVLEKLVLEENGLEMHMEDFSDTLKKEISDKVAWYKNTMHLEIAKRRDFRQKDIRIFTIDPSTAKDLDDAVHIRVDHSMNPPIFEIGVHIADVSHFVTPSSEVDEQAASRCTTVYLPRRNFAMLPREVCDDLCSLNPHEDKLTVSVVFFVDAKGVALQDPPIWFGQSVIRSVAQFAYEDVQVVLNKFRQLQQDAHQNTSMDHWSEMDSVRPETCDQHVWADVWSDLVLLEFITQQIRAQRFHNGSMTLHISNFHFHFDEYFTEGTSCMNMEEFTKSKLDQNHVDDDIYSETSHNLIEELMLLCNKYVAEKLYDSCLKEYAVIRYHPSPKAYDFSRFIQFLKYINLPYKLQSSKSLQDCFEKIGEEHGKLIQYTVEHLFIKSLSCAKYSTYHKSLDTRHFALSFPLYTHFTSPIRRYADILVHRLLLYVLMLEKENPLLCASSVKTTDEKQSIRIFEYLSNKGIRLDKTAMMQQCDQCNIKKLQAKDASFECSMYFFLFWLTQTKCLLPTIGSVIGLQDKKLSLFLPLLSCRGTIQCYNLEPNSNATQQNNEPFKKIAPVFNKLLAHAASIKKVGEIVEILWNVPHDTFSFNSKNTTLPSQLFPGLQTISQIVRIFSCLPVYVVPMETIPQTIALFPIPPWSDDFCSSLLNSSWLTTKQKQTFSNRYREARATGILNLDGFTVKKPKESETNEKMTKHAPSTKQQEKCGGEATQIHHLHEQKITKETIQILSKKEVSLDKIKTRHAENVQATTRIIEFNLHQPHVHSNHHKRFDTKKSFAS